ncbi:MAG: hypothetical protein AB3N28_01925 [Kordiimonas sp.]
MKVEMLKKTADIFAKLAVTSSDLLEKAAAEKDPSKRDLYIGIAAYELRKYEEAIESLKNSYKSSKSGEAAARLAMCYFRLDDFNGMKIWSEAALETNPDGQMKALVAKNMISYASLAAIASFGLGEVEPASEFANKALSIDAGDLSATDILVRSNLVKGEENKAQEVAMEFGLEPQFETLRESWNLDRLILDGTGKLPSFYRSGFMASERA